MVERERERERERGQIKEKVCGWQNSEDSLKGRLLFISCVFFNHKYWEVLEV
jgi:hypothetical protein